ncbi:ribosomal protein S10 domain-containing protein [Stachybotrys elegans]|uniref:Small ribosomal subunit protein uS10m n=1 Tax=Stachybotrys elegans TaxID=80388 RepID=A0A8K0WLN6_9HYPO|nr:ribosomal protein S10 domain-containing protein [Stachybotrys elegans]
MLAPLARPLARRQHALACLARRAQSSSASEPVNISIQRPSTEKTNQDAKTEPRYPRSLQALHLQPLQRTAEYGIPSCDLQLRSFSLQPLDFFADFALRAAYYLGLPAFGPVPLPRITQRWTVPRDHFIFKKSQENFERVTLRRLIQIKDGDPETVQVWLAYLRKHQFYGVGMKANMWEFSKLGVGRDMEKQDAQSIEGPWSQVGQTRTLGTAEKVAELLSSRRIKQAVSLKEAPLLETFSEQQVPKPSICHDTMACCAATKVVFNILYNQDVK